MLLPACIAAAALTGWGVLESAAPVLEMNDYYDAGDVPNSRNPPPWWVKLTRRMTAARLQALSPERQLLMPVSRDRIRATDVVADRAATLAATHPQDRVYAAFNAITASRVGTQADARLAASLDAIDRGRTLDPDNGLYPLLRAAALASYATQFEDGYDDESAESYARYDSEDGKVRRFGCGRIKVVDPARFAEARVAFHTCVAAPRLDAYERELRERTRDAAPAATDVASVALRTAADASAFDTQPWWIVRSALRRMAVAALDMAVQGRGGEALSLAADVQVVAERTLAACELPIVAVALQRDYLTDLLGHASCVLRHVGQASEADRLEAWMIDAQRAVRGAELKRYGRQQALGDVLGPIGWSVYGGPGDVRAYGPVTRAELHVADRAAVAATLVLFASVALAGVWAAGPWGRGRALVLLPGAVEVATLVGASVLVAGGVYAAWAMTFTRGLGGVTDRGPTLLAGYGVAAAAVLTATVGLSVRHGRRRLAGLGVTVPAPRAYGAAGGVALLTALAWATAWFVWILWVSKDIDLLPSFGVVRTVFVSLLACVPAVLIVRRGDGGAVRGVATVLRSTALRVALVGLIVGGAAVAGLYAMERVEIARFNRAGATAPATQNEFSDELRPDTALKARELGDLFRSLSLQDKAHR